MKLTPVLTWLAILICSLPFSGAYAQEKMTGNISGQVKNRKGEGVGAASVVLLRAADSALYIGGITDTTGTYTFFQVPAGTYIVQVKGRNATVQKQFIVLH